MHPTLDGDIVRFGLRPNPKLLPYLAQYPNDPKRRPAVRGAIVRGSLDDELFLVGRYIKPNLQVELFTVEHSQLLADGAIDPSFRHFGLAWYHSVLEANENGVLSANVRAIFLDQVFGYDAKIRPVQTGTFHIGLWFKDAHRGGPLAMISVPVAATGLGPLCTYPSERSTLAGHPL